MTHSGTFSVRQTADEVFDLLSNPERFAPLMPDFESMEMQDAKHFIIRTVIAIGEIRGHANLEMELLEASRAERVEYRGAATIAGSQLRVAISFKIGALTDATEVIWQGNVALDGMLALLAGNMVDTMGQQNFDRMAENLRRSLEIEPLSSAKASVSDSSKLDFDI
jgi:uncharacterized protein